MKSDGFFSWQHIVGLAQDYSNSIANALELLQSCTKPSILFYLLVPHISMSNVQYLEYIGIVRTASMPDLMVCANIGLATRYSPALFCNFPESKGHGANMGPTWGRQDPGGPHVGHVNLAIWVAYQTPLWSDL